MTVCSMDPKTTLHRLLIAALCWTVLGCFVGGPVTVASAQGNSSESTKASSSECDARLGNIGILASQSGENPAPLLELVKACPQAAEAHYALGTLYKRLGRVSEARAEFARALELRDLASYRIALAVVTFEMGSVDEAAQHFAKVLEADPRSLAALQGRAWIAAHQGDSTQALAFVERGLLIDGNNAGLLFNRAALNERAQKFREAAADYEKLTALDPKQIVAWCRLGMLRYVTGNSDAAIPALNQCVGETGAGESSTQPYNPDLAVQRAAGNSDVAAQRAAGGVFLARALAETGELERAELTLRRMIEKSPSDVTLKVALAEVYVKMQRFDEGMTQARAATMLAGKDQRGWAALGQAAMGIGDNLEAGEALTKARELGGKDASLINNLGVLELRRGRVEQARALFEEALKIDHQFEAAKNNLEKTKQ